MAGHKWVQFAHFTWCENCGAVNVGDYFVVGRGCVGTDEPLCGLGVDVPIPPNHVRVDPDLGCKAIRDHVDEIMTQRANLIDVLALKYGLGFQLVERRQGLMTTWTIEPFCGTCGHRRASDSDWPDSCDKAKRTLDEDCTPSWCPRRRPS
jgi:hypothetical protein